MTIGSYSGLHKSYLQFILKNTTAVPPPTATCSHIGHLSTGSNLQPVSAFCRHVSIICDIFYWFCWFQAFFPSFWPQNANLGLWSCLMTMKQLWCYSLNNYGDSLYNCHKNVKSSHLATCLLMGFNCDC